MEKIKSLHIVFSKIYSLVDIPFNTSGVKFNRAFKDYFNKSNCFKRYRNSIADFWQDKRNLPEINQHLMAKPDQPFIKDLGLLCLRANNFHTAGKEDKYYSEVLASKLGECPYFWDRTGSQELGEFDKSLFFGYDKDSKDQRYNFLYLELHKPLFISARIDGRTIAKGKINIHIFPNGSLTLMADISIMNEDINDLKEFREIIKTMRPTQHNKTVWESKVYNGALYNLIEAVRDKVISSVFKEPYKNITASDLHTAIKVNTAIPAEQLAKALLKGKFILFQFSEEDFEGHDEMLAISSRMLICQLKEVKKKKRDARIFKMANGIFEQTYYSKFVRDWYYKYLRDEVLSLKQCRLDDSISKITQKELWQFSQFNKNILTYLYTTDKIYENYTPFMRKLVHVFREGVHYNKIKQDTDKIIDEWDKELSRWKSVYSYVAKHLLGPIKKLLIGN